ncbi:universal stress protein [Streptomyces sp. NBC_01429]|uniref:universal stress protein n=1 Tax=Streptomyces sp. NBC_01429 TaxID=2903862 RepID=UPI002E28162D|nr:universal stress protein [Streptomyces sp. NBC_01429]
MVVGIDGSEGSLWAVDWAAAEAERTGLPLRLVHASLWERYEGVWPSRGPDRPSEQIYAENLVASAAQRVNQLAPDVKVSTDVQPEDPVAALLAESREATLLVVGPRGHGTVAGMLLGSVGLAVAARARCPVVVARGEEPNRRGAFQRVVLGVGESTGSTSAAHFAFRAARARGCELLAVRAWRSPARENMPYPQPGGAQEKICRRQAEESLDRVLGVVLAAYPEVLPHRKAVQGTAHQTLLEEAASADLLVVGARRRHGAVGLQLGRVNHAMLHHAPCPVAVVPAVSLSAETDHEMRT